MLRLSAALPCETTSRTAPRHEPRPAVRAYATIHAPVASIYVQDGEFTPPPEIDAMELAAALMFFTALVGLIQQFDQNHW